MKLNYKILWIDDRINEPQLKNCISRIKSYLSENEFLEPVVVCLDDVDQFNALEYVDYDLIITDYNIDPDNKRNGDKIINELRSNSIGTDVFFYSARNLPDTINLDRVTFYRLSGHGAIYDELLDRLKQMILLTLKLFYNIVAMRGLIMHETSSLDAQSKNILNDYINSSKCSPDFVNSVFFELSSHLKSKMKELEKYNGNIVKLMKNDYLFSSAFKIKALSFLLKILKIYDFSAEYNSEIISMRNRFAHAEIKTNEQGRQYFEYREDGITYDENLCKKIRRNILKHKRNLDSLERSLKAFINE